MPMRAEGHKNLFSSLVCDASAGAGWSCGMGHVPSEGLHGAEMHFGLCFRGEERAIPLFLFLLLLFLIIFK